MIFIASRPRIVGGEETRRAKSQVKFADVCGASQNVVAGIVGIGAKIISSAQL
jgi:hypothetical protein